MSSQTKTLLCSECGSPHLVEESEGRYHLCLYCHSLLEAGAGWGLRVVRRLCAHCGSENPAEAATCRDCGLVLTPRCLKCATRMAVWHDTCPRCGTSQAAYREQIAAQERERRSRRRGHRRHRRPWRSLWRMGWLVWPLLWFASTIGRYLRAALESLLAQSPGMSAAPYLANQTLTLAVGACIFGVGVVLLLVSLPSLLKGGR